jgi:hypothetical protein
LLPLSISNGGGGGGFGGGGGSLSGGGVGSHHRRHIRLSQAVRCGRSQVLRQPNHRSVAAHKLHLKKQTLETSKSHFRFKG